MTNGVLLDTRVFLSLALRPEDVPGPLRDVVDKASQRFLSVASAWEISIKYSIGKLPLPEPPSRYIPTRASKLLLQSLPITERHAVCVAALPMLHRDPFDRLLVAQAIEDGLTLVTLDQKLLRYDVPALRTTDVRKERKRRRR